MRSHSLLAVAALAMAPAHYGSAEVVPMPSRHGGFGEMPKEFREGGKTIRYGRYRDGKPKPAGTKLARKAERGLIGRTVIR
jgi:hypothetical protein